MPTTRSPRTPRVAPLELFYDLVFVVVIQQLSVRVESSPSAADYLAVGGLTAVIWLCWLNQLLLMNQLPARGGREIGLVLIAMAGLGVMAISFGEAQPWDPHVFVIGYVVSRTALWPLWSRTPSRPNLWTPFVFGPALATVWLATLALPSPLMVAAWAILVTVEVWIVIAGLPSVAHEAAHLSERAGLFVLILLGDCIAETVTAVTPYSPAPSWFVAAAAFGTTCLIWVTYFVVGSHPVRHMPSGVAPGYVRDVILIGHLILVLGLLLLAAGFNAAIDSAGAVSVPAATTIGISGGTVLVLAAQALIALRAGAPALRTSLWMFSLALTAAIPLASGPVAAFSSFGIACWALAIQGAVVILFWHGRVRDQRPPED